jgi:class 3 adenylate cyclase
MTGPAPPPMAYTPPPPAEGPSARLVTAAGSPYQRTFVFHDQIEIRRQTDGVPHPPGVLFLGDPTVSTRHCMITRGADGRFLIRDLSRNGTRVDGRRLMPNQEVEITGGQIISVGRGIDFELQVDEALPAAVPNAPAQATLAAPETRTATVLVGDIRNFTVLVRKTPAETLQRCVTRVFEELEREVVRLGGTVKEYQGDSLLAFWEEGFATHPAVAACAAALALDRRARDLAADRGVWDLAGHPLAMDWALSTGRVVLNSFGGDRPAGLSLVGEAVVRAYRIEKYADERSGSIVVCSATRDAAADRFRFRDLGERSAKGFDRDERIFALDGALPPETAAPHPGEKRS